MKKAMVAIVVILAMLALPQYVPAQPRQPAQVYVPVNPQAVSVSGTAAASSTISKPYCTLHATLSVFYTVNGKTATTSGATCFYLPGGASIDIYANPGTTISVIAADGSSSGYLYITEWE